MRKQKVNLTLTEQARNMLRIIASDNGVSMSVAMEMLIRANQSIKFAGGKR